MPLKKAPKPKSRKKEWSKEDQKKITIEQIAIMKAIIAKKKEGMVVVVEKIKGKDSKIRCIKTGMSGLEIKQVSEAIALLSIPEPILAMADMLMGLAQKVNVPGITPSDKKKCPKTKTKKRPQ